MQPFLFGGGLQAAVRKGNGQESQEEKRRAAAEGKVETFRCGGLEKHAKSDGRCHARFSARPKLSDGTGQPRKRETERDSGDRQWRKKRRWRRREVRMRPENNGDRHLPAR